MQRDNPLAIVDTDQAIESDPGQLWQWGTHDEFPMLPPETGGGIKFGAALSVSAGQFASTRSEVKCATILKPLRALVLTPADVLSGDTTGNASPRKAAHGPL